MVSKLDKAKIGPDEVTVYGKLDRKSVDAIDRVADQMLMPRSWVVAQIIREWAERRSIEITSAEQSWNDSFKEILSRHGMEEAEDGLKAHRHPVTA